MSNSLISVIIAAYNYEKFIGDTLQSVISQTYENWECLVVDDGSTDSTKEVVAKFAEREPRIKYLHQQNGGQASARNNALENSCGEYIQFLDADDLLESKKLEIQTDFLDQHPEVEIVYGDARYFRTDFPHERRFSLSEPDTPWLPNLSGNGSSLVERFIKENIMTVNAPLLRRSVVDKAGKFDTALDPLEDWDFWIRCALADVYFQFLDAEGTFALIRVHSLSSSQNHPRVVHKRNLVRQKIHQTLLPAQEANKKALELNRYYWMLNKIYQSNMQIKSGKLLNGISELYKFSKQSDSSLWTVFSTIVANKIKRVGART